MLDRLDDTIVAIASAAGYGPVGIVRVGGPGAVALVDRFARLPATIPFRDQPGSRRLLGEFMLDEARSVPAAYYLFRAPRSYTRQDLVEIQSIGAPPVLEAIRRRLIEHGARPAEPGEFTARAFLNGAMDLPTAESVALVIRAESDSQLRAARRMSDGALAERMLEARDSLSEILALVEAEIDFAEEPIDFITPRELRQRLADVEGRLGQLLAGSAAVEVHDDLPRILLFGRPNAGKSTLMNRLSGTDRSICAAVAGTTRDVLAAPIRVGAGEAWLLDAAGVDADPDEVLAAARQRTLAAAERVDLLCLVIDAAEPALDEVLSALRPLEVPQTVIAVNKTDRVTDGEAEALRDRIGQRLAAPVHLVSALQGTGLEALRDSLGGGLGVAAGTAGGAAILISARQRVALREAAASIVRARELSRSAAETVDCADLLAFELREALDLLGSVTGQVTTEDMLGQVFARFCIGK
jgi:tRNA modification GTPase